MKKLLVLFLIVAANSNYTQQFSNLNGIEDEQGNTLLLYSFGVDIYGQYSPVFKFNTLTSQESKIMDAYSIQIDTFNYMGKSVSDYEFFNNDTSNFINVGATLNMDLLGYAARNDSILFTDFFLVNVDISKQNPNDIFVSNFTNIYRSFDGGYTYPEDSTIEFGLVSVADYDENVFFGVDNQGNLIKSLDKGMTSVIVDTSDIVTALPFLKFYYDVNNNLIYRLNRSYGKITLNVSHNNGNAYTWTRIYESENPFFVSIDKTQNGLLYLADGRNIYKSTNSGADFSSFKTLPNKIVGIYKKPGSEIIYAASKYNLYKIAGDSITIVKSVPIPSYVFDYYPLNIGNKWVFNFTNIEYLPFPFYTTDVFKREIVNSVIKENNKLYYQIDQKFLSSDLITTFYERIDSGTGKIFRYEESSPDSEVIIDDLLGEPGDSLMVNRFEPYFTGIPTIFDQVEAYSEFGLTSTKITYIYSGLLIAKYSLVNKVGLEHILLGYDFASDIYDMKGFSINGIVYGDTTLSDVEPNPQNLPSYFELFQNYPNPFNPITKIRWQSPVSAYQTLKVYDVLGNEVATLIDEYRNAGNYEIQFDASQFASGVYYYQLLAGDFVDTKKMILLK